jgi:hypothetical protein
MAKRKPVKKAKKKSAAAKRKPMLKHSPAKTARKPTPQKPAGRPGGPRQSWLDEAAQTPIIDRYARQLGTFIDAVADGRIDDAELKAQERRLVTLMKEVEPKLDGILHEKVTRLLCEVTAYDIMHMLHAMAQSGAQREFQG